MTTEKLSRRWFQFSVGSLFWLMTVAATASFGIREYRERVRLERILYPPVFSADLEVPFSQGRWVECPEDWKP